MDIQEFRLRMYSEPIDYNKLPYDSIAAACRRMMESYLKDGTFRLEDMFIVLGDPMRGVSAFNLNDLFKKENGND
jgi:hypothetical protein